jgi:cytochrome P450
VGQGPVEPEHLPKLEYLDAVIKETARLTPVATQVVRRLNVPMRIGGHDLPAGVSVSAAIYSTHHRADLWPDPERFDPDRFVGTRTGPYTFFPFGGGDRRCLGAAFAAFEMKVILARVFARASLRLAPGYRARPVLRALTVAPSAGVPVLMDRAPA